MGNFVAWTALFAWPLVTLAFYRSYSLRGATLATIILGYLFLPDGLGVDLPVLPELDKHSIPALTALLCVSVALARGNSPAGVRPGWLPRDPWVLGLMVLLFAGAFGTALTNLDRVWLGGKTIAGLRVYDAFSISLTLLILLLPFILGRKLFSTRESQIRLLTFYVFAAAGYAVLALWEVRMSPQLNQQLYGYFPNAWNQHRRGGGWRPIVFLNHGLFWGIFLSCALIAAVGLLKYGDPKKRSLFIWLSVWMFGALFLSKVLGAFAIAVLLIPVILFLSKRLQLMVAFGIAVVAMTYPSLRNLDYVPTERILSVAESIDPQRASSLEFRFIHEDRLLTHAKERKLFGWGGWGRNRVYNEKGEDISVTDGRWVILFGQGGWVRYISEIGLILISLFRVPFMSRERLDPILVVSVLVLAGNAIDLLPNAGMSVVTWLLAGSVVGRLEVAREGTAPDAGTKQDASDIPRGRAPPVYARDFGPPSNSRVPTPSRNAPPSRASTRAQNPATRANTRLSKGRRA